MRTNVLLQHSTELRTNVIRMREKSAMTDKRPPIPPFTEETALLKVQAAEDAWNTRDPETIALAYTEDSQWRNRCDATTSVLTSGNAAPMHRSRPSRRAI